MLQIRLNSSLCFLYITNLLYGPLFEWFGPKLIVLGPFLYYDLEGYLIDHEIDDDEEEEDPRFTIIFSTRKNMSKLRSDRVFQLDATYRLNWNGFPVFVGGKC